MGQKLKTMELGRLYQEKTTIEALKKRLNDLLAKDPKACKKAALIIESWLHQKPKK